VCGVLQMPAETCANEQCKPDLRNVSSPLHKLRFHDLRHHAVTELAESQASEQTILSIAGHVSPRMLAHYSHVRLEAKRRAVDVLSQGVMAQTTLRMAHFHRRKIGKSLRRLVGLG